MVVAMQAKYPVHDKGEGEARGKQGKKKKKRDLDQVVGMSLTADSPAMIGAH